MREEDSEKSMQKFKETKKRGKKFLEKKCFLHLKKILNLNLNVRLRHKGIKIYLVELRKRLAVIRWLVCIVSLFI